MALVYVGEATFVDKDPVDVEAHAPRLWSPRSKGPSVYWYVKFPSLERAEYGLALLNKGPRSKWIDHEEVREVTFDSSAIAPLNDFKDAVGYLGEEDKSRHVFEEFPYVEVTSEEDYRKALAASLGIGRGPRDWSPNDEKTLDDESNWKGPGVYDFRDMTRHAKSVEEYEKDSMEYWANDVLDAAFDDDWEPKLETLLMRNVA